MENDPILEFTPFSSCVNPSFWTKFTSIKLETDRLSEEGRKIWGSYSNLNLFPKTSLELDSTSFNTEYGGQNVYIPLQGSLFNKNTIDNFKNCDKQAFIEEQGARLYKKIEDGTAIINPQEANEFFVLSFADLKKYNYYYWFAFPTIANIDTRLVKVQKLNKVLNEEDVVAAYKSVDDLNKVFFCLRKNNLEVVLLRDCIKIDDESNLSNFDDYYFAFSDPSTEESPGWILRNYIIMLLHHCSKLHGQQVQFLSLRLTRKNVTFSTERSLLFDLKLPNFNGNFKSTVVDKVGPCWCGWEQNERGNMGPRMSNMKKYIDSKCLAEQAADLNLKLMKWRLLPDIDLDVIKSTKCLLLGSGTLGCSVARVLLGWGVRNITLLDNATVSLSNPLRQSLFTYEDASQGKPKAEAAAENLRKIFPAINAKGVQMTIPMPGHPVSLNDIEESKKTVETLSQLILSHDIIFLLMDSRESRWLPTMLSTYHGKMVINAALGFDTYLVIRHGVRNTIMNNEVESVAANSKVHIPDGFKCIPGDELGCYFCNDITAPGDSSKDRTLDQQCTVTRPGVSAMAGALAAELAISLLQNVEKGKAPAFYKLHRNNSDEDEPPYGCNLGIIPHSIRGFLSNFSQIMPANVRCHSCIACSDKIISEYRTRGYEFLNSAFNSSKHLEDVLGLNFDDKASEEVWILSDNESSDSG